MNSIHSSVSIVSLIINRRYAGFKINIAFFVAPIISAIIDNVGLFIS